MWLTFLSGLRSSANREPRPFLGLLLVGGISVAMVLASCVSGRAQSAEDTTLWLQAKLLAATKSEFMVDQRVRVKEAGIIFRDDRVGDRIMMFGAMTSIYFRPAAEGFPANCGSCKFVSSIQLVGKSDDDKGRWVEMECKIAMYSASDEDAKRIVKALQHLARLNGAKIPQDDLF